MSKRILSMLLALVMALSLCVPAFAADEFEAEAPAVQEEETPAAPVAEEPDMPAAAAAEPEAAGDEPVAAAAGNGTFKVEGDESQIYAISQYDYTEYKDLGDPREVGVFPKAEIYIWLKPGYDVEETEGGGFNWYWEEEIPANDEDVLPAYVSWLMVPEEGGDMTVTARFLGSTDVTYRLADKADHTPGNYRVAHILVRGRDGAETALEGDALRGDMARALRAGDIASLELTLARR